MAPSLTTDLYDAIAPIYDEWQSWRGMKPFARVAAARLEPLLDRETNAARRAGRDDPALIDLGCGTGTLLAEVRRTRPTWRLAGVDASAGMLAVARAKLAAAKLDVKLAGASDVTFARTHLGAPLPFSAAFDVCTAFYDTLNHLLDTFFEGSPEKVVEALLGRERSRLSEDELERMARLIEKARKEGRRK